MPRLAHLALALPAGVASLSSRAQDLAQFVLPSVSSDPRLPRNIHPDADTSYPYTQMGDANGGNTFPGVSLPFGIVKLGPDLYTGSDSYSGYQPTGNFIGFSLLHESGTGGAPKYGVVSQMPVPGTVSNPLADLSVTRSMADETRLGYYKSSLSNGITVELGASRRAGMHQYTFPDGPSNVVVDVSHVLSSYRGQGLGQNYLGGNISVFTTNDGEIRYEGAGSYDNVRRQAMIIISYDKSLGIHTDAGIGVEPCAEMDCVFLRLFRPARCLQDVPGKRRNGNDHSRL